MKKIIVTEKISDKGVALLKAQKDLQVDVEMNLSREELLKRIPEYDAIIVRSVTPGRTAETDSRIRCHHCPQRNENQ